MPGKKENFQLIKGVGNVMKKPARKVGDSIAKGAKGMGQGMKKAADTQRKPFETIDQMKQKQRIDQKDILRSETSSKRKSFRGGGICKRGKGRAYGKNS